ncbi:MAG: hypothetical protein ACRDHL_06480 [Candidatus Promineifilaceae bacterium]
MPAVIRRQPIPAAESPAVLLGPLGPLPAAPMRRLLERRWLHYAFLARDGALAMVANVAWLGPDPDRPDAPTRNTSILLLHRRGRGWRASQFNAETRVPLWSSFGLSGADGQGPRLRLASTSGTPAVDFGMRRTSRACTSQCTPFAEDQHFRWQSESGVIARGDWRFDDQIYPAVEAVGYHERVRGYWGWPEMGGWVFGFANDPAVTAPDAPPPAAVVFTLIQPPQPPGSANASVMLWRDGRLRRHFPRRNVSVAVRGALDRNDVTQVPELANLFGVPPMEPVPQRLLISAQLGRDWLVIDFTAESSARIVIPNETTLRPFSVHEVIGWARIDGELNRRPFAFASHSIVEFAGGAGGL